MECSCFLFLLFSCYYNLFSFFFFLWKLQIRTIHAGTCLPCSQFSPTNKFENFPQKLSVCFAHTGPQRKILRLKSEQKLYPLKIYANASSSFSSFIFQPKLRIELSNSAMQRNTLCSESIGLFNRYCFSTISRRSISTAPGTLANKSESSGLEGGGKRNSSFFRSKSHRKAGNAIDASRRNILPSQSSGKNGSMLVSATKANDVINSKDQILVGDKVEAKEDLASPFDANDVQKPKAKGKKKQQSKSKGSKGQSSKVNATSNEVQKVSKSALKSKKPSLAENNQSAVTSEVSNLSHLYIVVCVKHSILNYVILQINSSEAPGSNISANDHPKPKTNSKSKRKKNMNEKASTVVKSDAAVTNPSVSKGSQSLRSDTSCKTLLQGHTKFPQLYPPIAKSVVVVESLTKAKIIQGYLGNMYEVVPSYGHVRDLAARSGSVRPDDEFSMVWEIPSAAWTHLKSIKVALSGYVIQSFKFHVLELQIRTLKRFS